MTVLRALLLTLAALLWAGITSAEPFLDLSGQSRVHSGDNPGWADPDFDDSQWPTRAFPLNSGWRGQGGEASDLVYWQRIPFAAAPDLPDEPVLVLGSVLGADRVFLNGTEIGAFGNFRSDLLTWETTTITVGTRLYAFDRTLLRENAPNVIAIRHARFYLQNAGVLAGPVAITSHATAFKIAGPKEARYHNFAAVLLFVDLAGMLAFIVYAIAGPKDRMTFWLAASFIGFAATAVPLSALIRELKIVPGTFELAMVKINLAAVAGLPEFVVLLLGRRFPKLLRLPQLLVVAAILISWPLAGAPWESLNYVSSILWLPSTLSLIFGTAILAGHSAWQGNRLGWIMLAAIATILLGYTIDILIADRCFILFTGFEVRAFTVRLFPFFLLTAALVRQRAVRQELHTAQERSQLVREEERKRIGRELHDGVGQLLTAVKLNAQMIKAAPDESALDDLIQTIDSAIQETRQASHALTPALLDQDGLIATLRRQADLLSRNPNAAVILNAISGDDDGLPPEIQATALRIFQEATANALRHGRASVIDVTFRRLQGQWLLQVQDNGKGFNPADAKGGIGLNSIEERAKSVGATVTIESTPGKGTLLRCQGPA